ncbi:iron-containing alcohol dehydrogenase [Eubacterium sp. am_0171]|uniref:iron-containing alcohol dehydrogenase n=1 Tax=unclassified Eubacterium (in: firmicutes) TaxID=2624479 RepID=UPI00101F7B47|nr:MULTISPECIES: iron-containing alcohol dehydrogenase [unclassified Eubacterium (in: firmicutes)]MSC82959.1 iron-containing alcohol dehydrogenase [Eubacterium sp. BIOML-A1]MSD04552.1 iron-containing alcohol dehydrogenase [Eubacterium sp. BIOML-A2]RYT25735.1 iron-containing alcohol dehydrogenase [Eubacterium sp. am_0171]
MIIFEFYNPTKVIFGKGVEAEAGKVIKEMGGHKVLVHFGGDYLQKSGTLDRIHQGLTEAGLEYVDLGGVVPNPRLGLVKEGIRLCKEEGVDFLLPIGGGSAIDSAKGIGYGLANDFELEDLLLGKTATDKIAPIGCISTIAATGSETSNSMVITIEDGMLKRSYNHDCARPKFAIMNPELTYTLPAYQTSSGASDIMMHTMERYFTNTKDVDLIDRMAEGLLVSVREAALTAVKDPENYEARATLMWAGSLSHNGLTGTGRVSDFASHKIEHELGGMFDVAHGAGLCAVWGSWARYVYKTNPARFAQFAVRVFDAAQNFYDTEATALKGIEAWENWCRSIGMPTSLRELGVTPTDAQIEEMAEKCVATGGGHVGFFQTLYKEDVIKIFQMAR